MEATAVPVHAFAPPDAPAEHLVEELESALEKEIPNRHEVPKELLGLPTTSGLLRYAAEEWVFIGVTWGLMFWTPGWLYPLWAFVVAARLHALGVILHDATHMPGKGGKSWGTRVLEVMVGYPIATTLDAMRYHHLRHHKDSGMKTDPYMKPSLEKRPVMAVLIWLRHLLLVPWWTIRAPFGLLSLVFPRLRNFYARGFLQDRSGTKLTDHPEVRRCAQEELGQLLFQAGIVGLAVLSPDRVFWAYLLPAWMTGLLAGYRVLREHAYRPTQDRSMLTIIQTTRDHNLTGLGRFIFAPRNIGYHIVHHLHPRVALENLPKLRAFYLERWPAVYPAPGKVGV